MKEKFEVGEHVTYVCQRGDPSHERLLGATIISVGPNKIWIECLTPKGTIRKLVNERALRKQPPQAEELSSGHQ